MIRKTSIAAAGLAVAATAVFAAGHAGPFDSAITARKSHMQLYAHNLGILGGMAKGALDYDAAAASAAATNLAALTTLNQATYWPPSSDAMSVDNTRALPNIWENFPDVSAKGGALVQAAAAMAGAAGNGLGDLQAAMGPLGAACGACHKTYREPK
ncbi:MAG: cytochrome c [Paracoccaceae bacterium]